MPTSPWRRSRARMSAVLALALLVTAIPREIRADPLEWTSTFSLRPPARTSFASGFDPIGNRYLIYSGYPWPPDLWALDLDDEPAWSLPSNTEAPRSQCTVAHDAAAHRLLVFGGQWDGHPYHDFRLLDLATGTWSYPPPVSGDLPTNYVNPPYAAAYDATRDRFVLLGGVSGGDSHVLDLATGVWTNKTDVSAADYIASAVYDPIRDRIIAVTSSGMCAISPVTFEWTVISGETGGAAMVYDAARDRIVAAYGGEVRAMSMADPPVWTVLSPPSTLPIPQSNVPLVLDTEADRLIVHGGVSTWGFSLATNTWSAIMPDLVPAETRWDHTSVIVRPWNAVVNFGNQFTVTAPVSRFALDGSGVVAYTPGGAPPNARQAHAAAYDPVRGRMVIFGGHNGSGGYFNDTHGMYTGGNLIWSNMNPLGTLPGKRAGVEALYDPVRDRVLMFGGYSNLVASFRDLWELSLPVPPTRPTWTLLHDNGPPEEIPALVPGSTALVHDSRRDRLIVLGTEQATSLLRAWACPLTGPPSWTPLAGSSTERVAFDAAYDSLGDRVLVFGGKNIAGNSITNDLMALAFPAETWSSLAIPNGPAGRHSHTFTRDAANHRFIVIGGRESATNPSTVWYLNDLGGPLVGVPPRAIAGQFSLASCQLVSRDRVRISATFPETGPVTLEVFDILGRRIGRSRESVEAGRREFTVALERPASSGLYFVRAIQGAKSARRKFVALH